MLSTHSATQNAAIAPPSAYIPCYSRQLAHHAHPRIPRRLVRIINGGCTPQRGGGRDALLPFSLLVLSSKSGVRCDKPQAFLFVLHFMNGFAINNRSPLPLSLPPSPSLSLPLPSLPLPSLLVFPHHFVFASSCTSCDRMNCSMSKSVGLFSPTPVFTRAITLACTI